MRVDCDKPTYLNAISLKPVCPVTFDLTEHYCIPRLSLRRLRKILVMTEIDHLRKFAEGWKTELLEQVIPFWMNHRFGSEHAATEHDRRIGPRFCDLATQGLFFFW